MLCCCMYGTSFVRRSQGPVKGTDIHVNVIIIVIVWCLVHRFVLNRRLVHPSNCVAASVTCMLCGAGACFSQRWAAILLYVNSL